MNRTTYIPLRQPVGLGYQHLQHLRRITLDRLVLEPLPMQYQNALNGADVFDVRPKETVAFRAVNRPNNPVLLVVGAPGLLSEVELMIRIGFSLHARRRWRSS